MTDGVGIELFLVVGLVFGALGGAMAFLITYEEYSHHHFDRRRLVRESLQAGGFAFVAILALALAAGFFISLGG